MSESSPQKKRRLVDITPLKSSPAFARLWFGSVFLGIGAQLTIVAVGLQIYDITKNTFMVGLVGGIALLPMIVAGPWGGMLADAYDRRKVLLIAITCSWLGTLGLVALSVVDVALQASGSRIAVWPFYVFTTVIAVAGTISSATRTATYPRVLDKSLVPSAMALTGISIGVQLTLGPALAGILVATAGFPVTFAADAVLALAGFFGVFMLPQIPPLHDAIAKGWAGISQGMTFLKGAPNIRASFIADIIAMSLGRPYALLPALAAGVIGGGPTTVGVLTSAAAIGTFGVSLFSGPVKHVHRYGLAITRAITLYGGFVLLFGVVILAGQSGFFGPSGSSWNEVNVIALGLGALCFLGMGASDEVSAIFRSSLLLTSVPDEMRGRLQGVFFSVVAGGPRLGDLYTGIMATAVAVWAPSIIGGIAIIVLIAVLARAVPSFKKYDKSE